MTNSISPSHKDGEYVSLVWHESNRFEGVRYAVRRLSLRQRMDLTRQLRDLMLRYEFLKAGDASDDLQATLAELEVQKLYVQWAIAEIEGLTIDGEPATSLTLIEKGPESLVGEMVGAIRNQLELSEEERKNS